MTISGERGSTYITIAIGGELPVARYRQQMTQTKTVAILLLIAVAAIGSIGIGTTEHALGSFGP
jgi:hypothetical protein